MSAAREGDAVAGEVASYAYSGNTLVFRIVAWTIVSCTLMFVLNNYLTLWWGWPGARSSSALGWVQKLSYVACLAGAAVYVLKDKTKSLRADSLSIYAVSAYIIRGAFWMVLIVGLVDMTISLLRVEDMLPGLVGEQMSKDLGRSSYRGLYVHLPLIVLSFIIAAFTRTLGFTWLALLVVVAELQIVISRFIFSYEQAFMGDLVRFWYAGLFLFASAYTLIEEGHVRVDVLYAGFNEKRKGLVNAIGSLLLGASLCYVVLWLGMGNKSSIINAPLLAYEVTQQGFGMYVKYLMAAFLAIFAISMMIQFAGYFLEGVADYRGDPDKREVATESAH
jgi:TRAP-type mannitol/chloroaromatic compound transport system permease small subunit